MILSYNTSRRPRLARRADCIFSQLSWLCGSFKDVAQKHLSVGPMEVRKEHVVEAGEQGPDGLYKYYYAYWLFTFRWGSVVLVARSYDSEPHEAHFLRKEVDGRTESMSRRDLFGDHFIEASNYLRQTEGKELIKALRNSGYEEVPVAGQVRRWWEFWRRPRGQTNP
jgi:hypothetical protein